MARAHLAAAEAVWDCAERSTRYLFGDSTGDPLADYIRGYLRDGPATRLELAPVTTAKSPAETIEARYRRSIGGSRS